jgi:hypothetical protein
VLLAAFSEFAGLTRDVRESRGGGPAKWTIRGRGARWAVLGSLLFAAVQLRALPSLVSSYGIVVGGATVVAIAAIAQGPERPNSFLLLARVACILQLSVLVHDVLLLPGTAAILYVGIVFHFGLGSLLFATQLGQVVAEPPMDSAAAGDAPEGEKTDGDGNADRDPAQNK